MRKPRTLAAHQPAYLPWPGYFERIAQADVFVFLDNVQFEKNSFINRNRIKTPQGAQWLTIPVRSRGHLAGTLRDTQIDNSKPWRADHLKAISLNYRKAAHFVERFAKLETLYSQGEDNLAELCWQQLQFWLGELGIATELVRASEMQLNSRKSDLVLEICQSMNASAYLSGALGKDYLDEPAFAQAGISVRYQAFKPPSYRQLWGEFVPGLSVLDWWMNSGDSQTECREWL